MLQVASSRGHLFTLLAFYHLGISAKDCGHFRQQCQTPVDSSSTLLQHSKCYSFWFCSAPFVVGVCECVREMQLEVPDHHVPVTTELHRHHLRHLCTLCRTSKGLGNEG